MPDNINNINGLDSNNMKDNFVNQSAEKRSEEPSRKTVTIEDIRRVVRDELAINNVELENIIAKYVIGDQLGESEQKEKNNSVEAPKADFEYPDETIEKEEKNPVPLNTNPFEGTNADFEYPDETIAKEQVAEVPAADVSEETVELPVIAEEGEEQAAPVVPTTATPVPEAPAAPEAAVPSAEFSQVEVSSLPETPVEPTAPVMPEAPAPVAEPVPAASASTEISMAALLDEAAKETQPTATPEVVSQPIIEPQVAAQAAPVVPTQVVTEQPVAMEPVTPTVVASDPVVAPVAVQNDPVPVKVVIQEYAGMNTVQFPGAGAKYTTASEEENAKLAAQNSPAKVLSQNMNNQ